MMKITAKDVTGMPKKFGEISFSTNRDFDLYPLNEEISQVFCHAFIEESNGVDFYPVCVDGRDGWVMAVWLTREKEAHGYLLHHPLDEVLHEAKKLQYEMNRETCDA